MSTSVPGYDGPWRWGESAVILADFIASRDVVGFHELRDRKLAEISAVHRASAVVAGDYAVTAGDEFQNLLADVAAFPRAIWDLRCHFQPLRMSIAVGVGGVDRRPEAGEPVNVGGSGEAFELARAAMEEMKSPRGSVPKYRTFTAFNSASGRQDLWINLAYRLLDSTLAKITARQWETIRVYRQTGRIEKTASRLGIDESTVSRNLRRGFYWQIEDTLADLEELVEASRGPGAPPRREE